MLEIRHLTNVYNDGTVALRDVSFIVPDGEFPDPKPKHHGTKAATGNMQ